MSKLMNTTLVLLSFLLISGAAFAQSNSGYLHRCSEAAKNIIISGGSLNSATRAARTPGELGNAYGVLASIEAEYYIISQEVSQTNHPGLQQKASEMGQTISKLANDLNTLSSMYYANADEQTLRTQEEEIHSTILTLEGGGRSIRAEIQTVRGN